MTPLERDNIIRGLSAEEGFAEYGAAEICIMEAERAFLEESVSNGYNADMQYLAKNIHVRENPALLLDGAKSVLCFLAPYKPMIIQERSFPGIASYAYGLDYHKIIKDKLYKICASLRERESDLKYRVFCDSAPVFERAWGARAGLGFIGKNSFLISKKYGLHTLIGVILLNREVLYGERVREGCGGCSRCIDACPVNAIVSPRVIDSRRCISYQTIESLRVRSEEVFPASKGEWIFGCDICLNACPWSSKGDTTSWESFSPLLHGESGNLITEISDESWLNMEDDYFNKWFKESPLMRAGLNKIKDNIK